MNCAATEADLGNITASIVAAYLNNNKIATEDLPDLITSIHRAVCKFSDASLEEQTLKPAVPIKMSVHPDYIICLEDGKKFKSLKRHLRTYYDMSPDEYRAKWGLDADYPMISANYAALRTKIAKKAGLGHHHRREKRERTET
ncbi:MAG: MucR family transcriptional regulator [Roseibium album]|uniref:MucR family transcriptional regulator n=1 Tax=Roseibium album TaxID=311410 RepID=UPI0032EFFA63